LARELLHVTDLPAELTAALVLQLLNNV